MAVITFNKFDLGIDHRKGASVSDANRLIEMLNAHVTSGLATERRPGITKVATLEAGTKGLFAANGVLNTFYCGASTITHANELFVANRIVSTTHPNVALKAVDFVDVFGGQFYVAATHTNDVTRHYYNGTEVPSKIRINVGTDAEKEVDNDCPHTKVCFKAKSKMWAVGKDGDTVHYSKVSDCTNWSEPDNAGFLPTGMNGRGSREVKAIGQYQDKMCMLMRDGVQVWSIDPDPTANSLDSVIENIGSSFSHSLATVSGDLYFLNDFGFRSITTMQLINQMSDVDIGSPVDDIVRRVVRNRGNNEPKTVFNYGTGKYMCAIGKQVFVYSVSRTAKIAAWSRYELPVAVDDWAELEGVMYFRSGDVVYKLDEYQEENDNEAKACTDEVYENGQWVDKPYEVIVQIPYMNFKKPGTLKHIYAIDIDIDGECYISVGTDGNTHRPKYTVEDDCRLTIDNSREYFTDEMLVGGNSYSGGLIPIEVIGTEFSFRFRCLNAKNFRIDAITIYYNELGVV